MTVNELILDNLEKINKRLDQLDAKMDQRFSNLKCSEQNTRLSVLEEKNRAGEATKALVWSGLFAAVSAFGLSLWQWIKG